MENMNEFIDIHSHILPQLDDGSQSIEHSLEMLCLAYDEGIRTIIATPHFREGLFFNTKAKIQESLDSLVEAAKEHNIGVDIKLGCEIYYSYDVCSFLNDGLIPTLNGTRYVLVEFSPMESYRNIRNGLMQLIYNGYHPILAHGERYNNITSSMELFNELVEMGVQIQVNAQSAMGEDGRKHYKVSKRLVKNNLAHYIATDTHNISTRCPSLKKAYIVIAKKYGDHNARTLLIDNPYELLKTSQH